MIRQLARILAIVMLVGITGRAIAADRWETLQAIHMIENPRNSTRPGSHGELGAYQFRHATWRMHTRRPFQLALNRAESDAVAAAHYEYLRDGLERSGVPATTYNIAVAWNAGLDAAISGHAPRASRNYAERVVNLTRDTGRPSVGRQPLAILAPMRPIVLTP